MSSNTSGTGPDNTSGLGTEKSTTNEYGIGIFEQHAKLLRDSAISVDVARERGYVSVDTKAQLKRAGFGTGQCREISVPGLLDPVHGVDGELKFNEYRPDDPRVDKQKSSDDKTVYRKYERPFRCGNHLDVPVRVQPVLGDATVELWVTEGCRKVDAAVSVGLACIGVMGVWGWSSDHQPIADLATINWADRRVVICFDHDAMSQPNVQLAMQRVADELRSRGAHVRVCSLPDLGDGKTGLDDYLAAGHTVDELRALVADMIEVRTVEPPGDPMANVPAFIEANFAHNEHDLLVRHAGDFKAWNGTCWPEFEEPLLRQYVYRFFHGAQYWKVRPDGSAELQPFQPTFHKVNDFLDALKAETHLPAHRRAPMWLSPHDLDPYEVIAFKNGLLHVPTRMLLPHTPTFYVAWSLPYDFDPDAPKPERWLKFLHDLWPDDEESQDTLHEWIGYNVSGDMSMHKMLMMIGPPRSGRSTIARVMTGLLGKENVAAPMLASLATHFGSACLVDKPTAIIPDARLHGGDNTLINNKLLAISGEDPLNIPRKYKDDWYGILPTRITMISNELPKLRDTSGALASRYILLACVFSFLGKENPNLTNELLTELPGILNLALEGLDRLHDRGYFAQPKSAEQLVQELEDAGSPVKTFVRECCQRGPWRVSHDVLYVGWREWCQETGEEAGSQSSFGTLLHAAFPTIKTVRPRDGEGGRTRYYEGLRFIPKMDRLLSEAERD